jgi:hypothetical protein
VRHVRVECIRSDVDREPWLWARAGDNGTVTLSARAAAAAVMPFKFKFLPCYHRRREQPSLSSGLSDAPWLHRRSHGSLYSNIEYDKLLLLKLFQRPRNL